MTAGRGTEAELCDGRGRAPGQQGEGVRLPPPRPPAGTRPVGSCPCCPPARPAVITGRLSERRALLANMLLMSAALELFLRGFCHGVGRAGGEDSVPQTHFTGGKKKGRCTGLPAVLRLSEHRASVPGTWVLGTSSKPLSLGWPRLLALSPLAGCGPPSSLSPGRPSRLEGI